MMYFTGKYIYSSIEESTINTQYSPRLRSQQPQVEVGRNRGGPRVTEHFLRFQLENLECAAGSSDKITRSAFITPSDKCIPGISSSSKSNGTHAIDNSSELRITNISPAIVSSLVKETDK